MIGLSIAVSTLVLPLYAQAERIQEKERKNQEKMKSWLTHIQKTFSGDERYMIQNAYYKEQGYKPFYALKGTLSLLLQIPFFLAAYQFLSHLKLLQGCAFGVIRDLGVEDGLITIGENHVNLLPVLMTLINFVSSTIYTRGFSIKEKLQPYLLAAVFLVLLYHSPSGLVLYWTMNNLYSLVKNMIMKVNWRRYRIDRIASVTVSMLLLVILYQNGTVARMVDGRKYEDIFQFLLVLLGFTCPLWMGLMKTKKMQTQAEEKNRWILPMETMICILLLGVYIPLTVISSSPGDFVEVDRIHSPLSIMFSVLMVMIGFFLFWGNVIGAMIDRKKVVLYEGSLFSFIIVAMWNTFTYKPFTGRVSTFLKFEFILKSDIRCVLRSLAVVGAVSSGRSAVGERSTGVLYRPAV
ncbi:MAG: YidC/Oxa1 family membrane protein insertase, partial [Lachnospiraceae bacterium]|nr:YidC/Oxa1 family membrane protein insertase [Lachnospiraceae bacterium]